MMTAKSPFVLFGDAEPERAREVANALRGASIRTGIVESSRDLLETARRETPDVVVVDDRLESLGSDILLNLFRRDCPASRVVLLLSEGTHPERDALRHLEPVCTLVRPLSNHDLFSVISAAIHGPASAPPGGRPQVVLCVDDDALFLRSLVRVLRSRGYAAVPYDQPEAALEAIPLLRPDLAFIDVLMPGMNGLDLAAEIREDYGDALPLVLLSARSSDREIAEGIHSGARRYLTKPCEPEMILDVARELIGRGPPLPEKTALRR
jgi:DNA-binding response OmpR family regulator